ncbi:unnamed protein product [Eruca vesicaria subsp. sativa]|uniref:Uncharacterized protein n=1 Tax=Eruca vesicaria subsp. sativa TaxID=29727 RepID=A0ABC8KU81_ERUVS|nr:unnamed protein product [Eruca vesicaria subsp. sativa]
MTHAREWRSSSLLMVIFLSSLLYLLSVNSRIGAIRVFPETSVTATSLAPANNQEDPMKTYFGAGKGFGDGKRTVPSGPDPLHN